MIVAPDGRRVYVANSVAGSVSVLDTATNAATATIAVGHAPDGLAISPDGKLLYVANGDDATVTVVDTASAKPVGSPVPVGKRPRGIAVSPDGKRLYVAGFDSNDVTLIDTASATPVARAIVDDGPVDVAVSRDGARLFVVNQRSSTISVIDTVAKTSDVAAARVDPGAELDRPRRHRQPSLRHQQGRRHDRHDRHRGAAGGQAVRGRRRSRRRRRRSQGRPDLRGRAEFDGCVDPAGRRSVGVSGSGRARLDLRHLRACSTPTPPQPRRTARSARTSGSTSAGTASGGRPLAELARDHATEIREEEPGLLGIGVSPPFAIGQRALLVRTPDGNVLWDCDPAARRAARGSDRRRSAASPRSACPTRTSTAPTSTSPTPSTRAILHPAGRRAVDPAPVAAHRAVRRRGRARARRDAGPHRRALRRGRGAALAGGLGRPRRAAHRRHDHRRPGPRVGQLHVELPQPHPAGRRHRAHIADRVAPFRFDRIYGGWWGRVVLTDGPGAVRRSAERYVARIQGP